MAATVFSSCATLLAPISADVTRPRRSTQAMASCASVCPRRFATSFSARTVARVSSVSRSRVRNGLAPAARESAGTPSR